MAFGGARLKIAMVVVEAKDKALYRAEQVSLPVKAGQKVDASAALEVFRDAFVKDVDGLVTSDADIKLGKMAGKEYVMDSGKTKQAKLRIYVTGPRVYMISMIGSKQQIEGESAKIFFDSFKHQGMVKDELKAAEAAGGGSPSPGSPSSGYTPVNRGSRIVGGGGAKEATDRAPEGGYLRGPGDRAGQIRSKRRDSRRQADLPPGGQGIHRRPLRHGPQPCVEGDGETRLRRRRGHDQGGT